MEFINRSRKATLLKVQPYGLLFGFRNYLVGRIPEEGGYRLFALDGIRALTKLDEVFAKDQSFSLRQYASQSFGVFQEKIYDVVWRVAPEVAADANSWEFHPTQKIEPQSDGSILVRFKAGGLLEMAWHLFTWQGKITVLEPPELNKIIASQCALADPSRQRDTFS